MINRRGPISKTAELRLSPKRVSGLSEYRRGAIENDLERGIVKEAGSYESSRLNKTPPNIKNASPDSDGLNRGNWVVGGERGRVIRGDSNAVGAIAHSESYMRKQNEEFAKAAMNKEATVLSGVGSVGSGSSAGSSFDRLVPEIYSPLYTMANLNLPRDRITINAWCRNFFLLNPIVRNAITLHSTYPISKLNLKCHDKRVLQFFEDMVEEMDLVGSLGEMSLEWWKLGETFPFAELDDSAGKWSKIVIQNPDYINVRKSVLAGEPIITLKPDAVLQRLVFSNNPADVQIRKQIPEDILYHVRNGRNIPLDNFNVSHLKMLASPYDIRGTSVIVSVFKDLMLYDRLRESKFAQADSMINPVTLIKVGGNTEGEYRASQEDLEFYRQIFEEAEYDKNAKIVTHAGVAVERVGFSGHVLDIAGDIEHIVKNIYTGLMVPPAVVDTESAVYSSASIGLEVLRQRYFNFRNMMARWLMNKIFAPISEIQDFYEYKDKEKHLIIPEIEWNQMNLYDLQDYIGNITGMVSSGQAAVQTLYRSLGLNYDDEKVKMRRESIDKAIRMREENALASMSLSELRTLDPEKPIMEPIDSKEREKAEGESPSGMPDMGGDMGVPGLPELSPSPGMSSPGAGAPEGGGITPPMGPGGGPEGPGGLGI